MPILATNRFTNLGRSGIQFLVQWRTRAK